MFVFTLLSLIIIVCDSLFTFEFDHLILVLLFIVPGRTTHGRNIMFVFAAVEGMIIDSSLCLHSLSINAHIVIVHWDLIGILRQLL